MLIYLKINQFKNCYVPSPCFFKKQFYISTSYYCLLQNSMHSDQHLLIEEMHIKNFTEVNK